MGVSEIRVKRIRVNQGLGVGPFLTKEEKLLLISTPMENSAVCSRSFSLSTPTFLLSTPVENSEATLKKKATKCNKYFYLLELAASSIGTRS